MLVVDTQSTSSGDVVRSLSGRWPPPSCHYGSNDTWSSGSDHSSHLGQLTINTGWNASTFPTHSEVSVYLYGRFQIIVTLSGPKLGPLHMWVFRVLIAEIRNVLRLLECASVL